MIKEEEIKTPKIVKQDPSIESKNAKKGKIGRKKHTTS